MMGFDFNSLLERDRRDRMGKSRGGMTAEQFAEKWAKKSGYTIEQLREMGREVRPCDCGEDGCRGWQMAHIEPTDAELAAMEAKYANRGTENA